MAGPVATVPRPLATPRRRSRTTSSSDEASSSRQAAGAGSAYSTRSLRPPQTPATSNQAARFRTSQRLMATPSRVRGNNAASTATPHGRAAIRELDSRRAAINNALNTPGRNRRRSMRDQRETPRDILRALGRVLAPTSKAISSSSSSASSAARRSSSSKAVRSGRRGTVDARPRSDSDDDFPIDRPRLSLPIDDMIDDSDDELQPPRLSGIEELEANYTARSIELPRRATTDPLRFSGRPSDFQAFQQSVLDDVDEDATEMAFNFYPPPPEDDEALIGEDGSTEYERLDADVGRRETLADGRQSEFGLADVSRGPGDQSTFVIAPQLEDSPLRSPSPNNVPFGIDDEIRSDQSPDDSPRAGDESATGLKLKLATATPQRPSSAAKRTKSKKKISKHGIQYPSLPSAVVKSVAQMFAPAGRAGKAKISPDTMAALTQASDWFFEQLGEDLQAFAHHAGRKTIDESDVLMLMQRQRQTNKTVTPFSLAQRHLPRELVQELRMKPATKLNRRAKENTTRNKTKAKT